MYALIHAHAITPLIESASVRGCRQFAFRQIPLFTHKPARLF
jgi:hypothetical protein